MNAVRLRIAAAIIGMFAVGVIVVGTAGAGNCRRGRPSRQPSRVGTPRRRTAIVPSSQHVDARVWLAPNNSAQLDSLAQAVSDPSSAQYRQYLTPAQYDAQFAPTSDQVAAVKQWLTGAGLSVVTVGPDNHYVAVAGSAAAINAAFGTQLALYKVNGTEQQAPSTDLTVPSSVASSILAVTGLSPFGHATKPADFGAPPAFVNATPCSSYYGQQAASTLPRSWRRRCPTPSAATRRRSSARPTASRAVSRSVRASASASASAPPSRSPMHMTRALCL